MKYKVVELKELTKEMLEEINYPSPKGNGLVRPIVD